MSTGYQFQRLVSLSSHSFRRAGERFEAKKKKRDNKRRKKERQIKVLDKIQTFFSTWRRFIYSLGSRVGRNRTILNLTWFILAAMKLIDKRLIDN